MCLPHLLLYLRYISDETQLKTLQASLNKSLRNTMHIYGHPTALLSETGFPPLYITQNLQLAQLRFRLYSSPTTTIQHFLGCLWQPLLLQAVPLDTLEDCKQNAVGQVDPPRRDPNSPMPHNLTLAKPHNKTRSYKKYLETQCSDQWRKHLKITPNNPPGRVRAYVDWHLHSKHKRSMYKPAPYPSHPPILTLPTRAPSDPHPVYHQHYTFPPPLCIWEPTSCIPRSCVPVLCCLRYPDPW